VRAAFACLWAVWPVKKGEFTAFRRFAALARAGDLPAVPALLCAVDRLMREDAHWLNGYPPLLANWLGGHGWNDEPFTRAKRDVEPAPARPEDSEFSRSLEAHKASVCPPERALEWIRKIRESVLQGADERAAGDEGVERQLERVRAFKATFVPDSGTACFA
jgi:hypothetical protein